MSDWEDVFGFSDDPTPGDADMLGDLARQYRSVADNAGDALPLVSGLEGNQVGEGKTMDKLRDKLGDLANQVRKLHSSYDQAAGALDTYVNSLRDQQHNADKALEKGREAKDRLESATDVVKAAGADISRLDGEKHPPDDKEARASTRRALEEAHSKQSGAQAQADDAQADLDAARMLAEDARQVREEDAATAAQKLDDARDESVAGYSLWDKIKKAFSKAFAIISAVLGVLALLIPGLQGLGIALTIGAVVAGAASLGINMSIMAETGDWDIGEIVLGVVGLVAGGGALLKGLGSVGSALKGIKPGAMKNIGSSAMKNLGSGSTRSVSREAVGKKCATDPVDVATGEMLLMQTDLELPGVLPLALTRTHLSTYRYGQFFGPSWASTLDERLEVDDRGRAWWAREDGSILTYPRLPETGSVDDLVWPDEGPRLPLAAEETAEGEVAFVVREPRTGLVHHFADRATDGADETRVHWLTRWHDRNDNEVRIEREADGSPTAMVHSGGYRVELNCVAGLLLDASVVTPEGPVEVTSYERDTDGNLSHIVNSSGKALVFGYDEHSRITSWTDRNDSTYRYVYDETHRVTETIGPDGHLSSQWSYDPAEQRTHYTDSTGATTTYQLNDLHQVVAETDPLGHTTHSEWDRYDHLLAHTDALGSTTRYEWDAGESLTLIEQPDGGRTQVGYNALHLPTEIVLPGGAVQQLEYDARGNRTAATAPDGAVTRYTHAPTGAVATLTEADGAQRSIDTDPAGLPVRVVDALGAETRCTRDAFGRPTTVTDALGGVTRLEWTVEGLLSRRTASDGSVEEWRWDGEGNCLSHTDPAGGTTAMRYTHFDLLAERTTPDGVTHAFAYDTELHLTQVTNPQGLTWNYSYDRAGRPVGESDFDGRTVTYAYDAAGRLTSHTTRSGAEIRFERDAVGRVTAKDAAGAVTRYTHDALGRLTRAESPQSVLELAYDAGGRLLSETVDGRAMRYGYDLSGQRISRTTPTGAVSTYAYDAVGNRTAVSTGGHELAFQHDALGRETERFFGAQVRLSSTRDDRGRLTHQSLTSGHELRRARSYGYRPDSYLTSLTEEVTGEQRRFDLDPVGRPLTVSAEGWNESYAYDAAGNQTAAQWPGRSTDGGARGERSYQGTKVLSAGKVRYEHDAAGRMTLRQRARLSKKPDTWRYEWDAEDRLTACTTPDGTRWTYTYDPLGRRTAKHRSGEEGAPAESVHFTWDGTSLAEESTSRTGVTVTWDHDGHRPLTQYERRLTTAGGASLSQDEVDSRFFAMVTDLVGTPTELVDEQGEIAWHTRSTVWGTTTWNRDATAYTPLRFPGQYADHETGLYYNFFRHYDPETARFASPDPLGLTPAPNPVAYVDSPLTWADPLGLAPCSDAELLSATQKLADDVLKLPKGQRGGMAEAISLREGGDIITGVSGKGNTHVLHRDVQNVLDNIPLADRTPVHGKCGLPQALTKALNDGRDPTGAKGAAIMVRSPNNAHYGATAPPCANCQNLVNHYGIDFIT
ncbi:DUF6531 domain-containing protein [Streptomyces sp. 2224.1]|uniref:DUF6531 domain-containing protein n=1 Tax=Streptomyces sp. 2224.1 TaxID=1881020 RepID=UPI000B80D3E6|nr:DUF6531 domain-containing protein [Streptomyces sp. 2224.1]